MVDGLASGSTELAEDAAAEIVAEGAAVRVCLLPGTLAALECTREQTIEAGDHYILLGKVTGFGARDGEPLLYFGGKYRHLKVVE